MHTVVSSPSPVENVEVVVAPKANKPKKLSGKYEKFLVFGYCFIQQLKDQNIAVDETVLHQLLTMFSSVEEQTQYFEAFFAQLKASTKSMKAVIKEHNKPPAKAKKTKKEPTDKPAAAKKTNGRKKKNAEVINDKQDELVAELVAAAQTTEEVHQLPLENDDKPKRKYSRKPKANATVEETTQEHLAVEPEPTVVAVLENVIEAIKEPLVDKPKKKTTKKDTEIKPKEAKETKETKPKETKAKAKKTKKAEEPVKETFIEPSPPLLEHADKEEEEEEEEEEIQVQTFLHKGIQYLRDFNNNIYDKDTCEVIGLYDPSTDAITFN
jgi:hypothetical protein